jgi:peroxisome-assembly ATPase
MIDIHKASHKLKMEHGNSLDAAPIIARDLAGNANILCLDEFQVRGLFDLVP